MMPPTKQSRSENHRRTFGFLATDLNDSRIHQMWLGALDAARSRDVNLIRCVVGDVSSEKNFEEEPRAVLCDVIDPQNLDGLIVTQFWENEEWFHRFYERYQPLPVVVLGRHYQEYPGVKGDGNRSLQELLEHLIVEHGYTHLGYVRSQKNEVEESRYQTYRECLARHGLVFDSRLVTPPDTRIRPHTVLGEEGVRLFFDERRLIPGQDIEALVAYDDDIASGVLAALRTRGIQVPDDLAVTGFDSHRESELTIPPLTTTSNARYEHGWQAVVDLLAVLNNETACPHTHLTLTPIIRESCGCMSTSIIRAGTELAAQGQELESSAPDWQTRLLREIAEQCGPPWDTFSHQIERVAVAFLEDVSATSPGKKRPEHFLRTFERLLYDIIRAGEPIDLGHDLLSILRTHGMIRWKPDCPQRSRLERLVHQARVLAWEVGRWGERLRQHQAEEQTQRLRQIGQRLTSIFDLPTMMDVLAEELPQVHIPGCMLALYADPDVSAAEARMMLAYTEEGRLALDSEGRCFASRQLDPSGGLLHQDRQFALVVEPLYFGQQQSGFVLFEVGPREGAVYESLRKEISSALQGVMLVQKVQENAAEIARQKYVLDTFMANVPDSIYFKDRESRFIRGNQSVANLFGVDDPAHLVGKSDFDFFPDAKARPKYEQEQEIIRTGQPLLASEELDAQGRWALTTKMPLRDEHGDIIGTFGISRDITALKQMQAELEQRSLELATSYEEIRILNEQLKDENVRMSAELNVARRLQTMILPPAEELQQIEGFEIVGYMQPADEVGGDYYDVIQANANLHIGIGDVTGHGLESGVLMLMTQTAIRTLIEHGETDPVKFVNTLNRTIYKNVQRMGADKTLTFVLVNYADKHLRIVGQHEELLIVRARGRVERMDTMNLGFPIGLEEDIAQWVASATVMLEPGDGIVLYTDGITEAENMQREMYGLKRLCTVVSRNWNHSARVIQQAVIDDVMRHIGQQKVYDDITLVVLKQE